MEERVKICIVILMYKQHNIKLMVIQIIILDLLYREGKDVAVAVNLYDSCLSKLFIVYMTLILKEHIF